MNTPKKLTEKMTCKEMCEAIASRLAGVTAREIFELSPTGELYYIPILYEYVVLREKSLKETKEILDNDKETDKGERAGKSK